MQRHSLSSDVTIHTHACGEGGIFVNAYLVETRAGVVAIDATLTETESKLLRAEVDGLGKPLLAVLVTHPHPDHVAGITNLVAGGAAQIVATQPPATRLVIPATCSGWGCVTSTASKGLPSPSTSARSCLLSVSVSVASMATTPARVSTRYALTKMPPSPQAWV